jgi:PAS domain S-box-containing protein
VIAALPSIEARPLTMTTQAPPLIAPFAALPASALLDAFSQLHQAVLVLDRRGRVTWISDADGVMCGAPGSQLGVSTRELPLDPADFEELRQQLLAHGRVLPRRVELRFEKSGTVTAELSVVRLPGEHAEPRFLATLRPVPSPEAADSDTRHTLDSLGSILDSSPEAVLAIDAAGLVTYGNPALERLLGFPPRDLIGEPVTRLLWGADDFERACAAFRPATDGQTQDVKISRADGSTLCAAVSASPLRRTDGARVGTVAILRDVTERRRHAAELARKNAELESYVHSVSHDLRSPLVSLLGFSRLLRQDHGDQIGDSGRHFLDRIEQAGRTMEALINDLLELSRIGETGERKALVDPLRILMQLRAELKPRLEAQDVELSICENPPLVLCDRTRLYQVFSNLMGNALDHMGPQAKARIEIDVREESDVHHVSVRDNGRGIDPAHHERIFEIFQSLGPRADGRRGTGVGLAIVKKIAETHGGRVWVESAVGRGACFHLTLPRG